MRSRCRHGALALILLAVLAPAGGALAHLERTSYLPDPRAHTSGKPAAGGRVPTPRSLYTALARRRVGATRVVCKSNSLQLTRVAITKARTNGVELRPSVPAKKLTRRQARALLELNKSLLGRCRFHDIQPAVTATHNNDRVVIMPGLYTEDASRAVPSLPEDCEQYRTTSENGSGAGSSSYHYSCPNAQSVIGMAGGPLGPGQDPPATALGRPD